MNEEYTQQQIKEIIKSTLFVSGEGVEIDAFKQQLNLSDDEMEHYIKLLKNELCGENGVHLIQYRNKLQLTSNPDYVNEISDILNPIRERALTKAALETIAIIAYKQPITKLEIEEIRGVGCDYTIQLLTEHNMIEVVGRKDAPGRPLLFGTTDTFLKRFSLSSLEDLPNYDELLDRIKVIYANNETDGLYRDFKISNEDIIPENEGETTKVEMTFEDEENGDITTIVSETNDAGSFINVDIQNNKNDNAV